MSSAEIKMPGVSKDRQCQMLIGNAKKINYRCAECTKPIDKIGFCNNCKCNIFKR